MTTTLKLKTQTAKEKPMGFMTRTVKASEVKDAHSFAAYAQQTAGIPMPTGKGWVILQARLKDFFACNPQADWGTCVRLVDWARSRKRRVAHTHSVLTLLRYAWSDGALPEFNARDKVEADVERGIQEALTIEGDPEWRRVLIGSKGEESRREVLSQWRRKRSLVSR